MSIYVGEQHQAFVLRSESTTTAGALLIHGFTGTPAEMRALGTALCNAGIDVHAPLLPGFGPNVDQLPHVRADDWIRTARQLWEELGDRYDVRYLVGFSMGGAVALQLAVEDAPDKLVLIAPFWKMADRRAALLPLIKLVRDEIQTFEPAALDDPGVREAFARIDSSLDLDDPAVRERLARESALPTSALVELQRVGRVAGESADSLTCQTLVVQGLQDDTVLPERTRELVGRIPDDVKLLEVSGDHLLVWDDRASWPAVRDAVVEFLSGNGRG